VNLVIVQVIGKNRCTVNPPLALVGYEKIPLDAYRKIGLSDDEILPSLIARRFMH
jgi:hypothetical protein